MRQIKLLEALVLHSFSGKLSVQQNSVARLNFRNLVKTRTFCKRTLITKVSKKFVCSNYSSVDPKHIYSTAYLPYQENLRWRERYLTVVIPTAAESYLSLHTTHGHGGGEGGKFYPLLQPQTVPICAYNPFLSPLLARNVKASPRPSDLRRSRRCPPRPRPRCRPPPPRSPPRSRRRRIGWLGCAQQLRRGQVSTLPTLPDFALTTWVPGRVAWGGRSRRFRPW